MHVENNFVKRKSSQLEITKILLKLFDHTRVKKRFCIYSKQSYILVLSLNDLLTSLNDLVFLYPT